MSRKLSSIDVNKFVENLSSEQKKRVIHVHSCFLNQNRFDLKNLNTDQIFEVA